MVVVDDLESVLSLDTRELPGELSWPASRIAQSTGRSAAQSPPPGWALSGMSRLTLDQGSFMQALARSTSARASATNPSSGSLR